jgi:hypothetical protein
MLKSSLRLAIACALSVPAAACGGDTKKSDDGSATAAAAEASAPTKSADDGKVDTGKPAEPADEGAPDDGAKSTDAGDDAKAGSEGKVADDAKAADEGKAEAGATGGAAPVDPAPLLEEVKAKKTKDERAMAALAEAEAAGAEARELAKVANARGEKLFEHPERAKAFFEWAAEKDPKFPEPAFNLAKQAAIQGDVDLAKEWLVKTKERGGKKLLKQIGFDPMWEIVKDDPDVRKLYE